MLSLRILVISLSNVDFVVITVTYEINIVQTQEMTTGKMKQIIQTIFNSAFRTLC